MAKPVGLRTEILVTLVVLLGAALLLGGVMMLHLTEQNLLTERLRQLDSAVALVARLVEAELKTSSSADATDEIRNVLSSLPDQLHCSDWWYFDSDLTLVESAVGDDAQPLAAATRQIARMSGEIQREVDYTALLNLIGNTGAEARFAVPFGEHQPDRLVELHFSLTDIRSNLLKTQWIVILYVLLYGVVLVLAGYYLLQKNVIRPARNLLDATEAVGRGDLETRLPTEGPAEIGQLAQAYNRMVDALQQSRRETETHIDSLEETNRQLGQTRDELIRSEKMASVGQLAAGLAHELGNPLAALIGYLELLKKNLTGPADCEIAKRSLAETQRIDFLVRELLDFSRPTDDLTPQELDPLAELKSCVELLSNQGGLGDVVVDDRLPGDIGHIRMNPQKLQQVFINLLLNAVQACNGEGRITLTAGGDDQKLWISVQDNGCGITANQQQKVFEPFYTTKAPGQGTGLGLAISQRIIEEAGGRIEVESGKSDGSLFRIVLPAEA